MKKIALIVLLIALSFNVTGCISGTSKKDEPSQPSLAQIMELREQNKELKAQTQVLTETRNQMQIIASNTTGISMSLQRIAESAERIANAFDSIAEKNDVQD